jgi:polysaccharide biosynthesis/export protein
MLRLVNVILAIIIFCAVCLFGQEGDKAPPKELLQYVRDAQKAGLNTSEIQQNAVNAGWPSTVVTDTFAYLKTNEGEKPKSEADAKPAPPSENASASVARPEEAAPNGSGKTPASSPPSAAAPDTGTGGTAPATTPKDTKTAAVPSSPTAEAGSVKSQVPQAANIADEYKIGAGDVLKITVWHEPDASLQSAIVLPTGRISVPLLHEIDVAGLSVPQLEKLLTERFSSLINAPEVSVVVLGMNSKKIYMSGKIKKEGPLPYVYEMTVMQALSEAGGVTDYAKKKNIYVLRTENGKQFKLPFDYAAVLKGEHLETNIQLIPGDMIVVP